MYGIATEENRPVSRISMSLPYGLLCELDRMVAERGFISRSQAISDMLHQFLIEHKRERGDDLMVGTVTLVYDHHVRLLNEKLTDLQHEHHRLILSTLHVHLDHNNCLEVLVVKGQAREVQKIAEILISTKGVKHGRLTITTSGAEL